MFIIIRKKNNVIFKFIISTIIIQDYVNKVKLKQSKVNKNI